MVCRTRLKDSVNARRRRTEDGGVEQRKADAWCEKFRAGAVALAGWPSAVARPKWCTPHFRQFCSIEHKMTVLRRIVKGFCLKLE
jgi:hypothetical protein